jgi:SepF-like predicted cell division protein (DUF552 family)
MNLTYKELKELIKDKPDEEEVQIYSIGDYTEVYTLEKFLIDNKLVIGGVA